MSTSLRSVNLHAISKSELDEAFPAFRGQLLRPEDPGYEEHRRVWNRLFDARPALVARCRGAADVQDVVNFARRTDRLLAVRGGGHSIAGKGSAEDAVVIDLSLMCHARVEEATQTLHVEGGATWADVDREAGAFNLVAPGGALSMTGVGGVTTGGGFGWLVRRFGLCLDNVTSMDVVLASGDLVTCNKSRHPDLFWAVLGGGGNFGVVTRFEFGLHRINPDVLHGVLSWPIEDAAKVMRYYGEMAADLPREIGLNAQLVLAPSTPEVPAAIQGKPIFILIYAYHGDNHADGVAALEPLRAFCAPVDETRHVVSYRDLQTSNDARCPATRSCWQTGYLDELGPALDVIIAEFSKVPSALCVVEFLTMSGAISDVADEATAFRRRNGWVYNIMALWDDPQDDSVFDGWSRGFHRALEPYSSEGAYINFFSENEDDRVPDAYGPSKLTRLREIKRTYDPDNLFSINHNIAPSE